ncbi:hypothetical protein J1605_004590 [Eschrichtius robustus]|uniref:Flavodoxin-like fold domain-containing protein n=2 Tax=Mysticeti TaxID=9761 RepID=A0AB34HGT6_ESCRO|nr:hypothetical protein J1605_004590 [Eschrichtius robustus]
MPRPSIVTLDTASGWRRREARAGAPPSSQHYNPSSRHRAEPPGPARPRGPGLAPSEEREGRGLGRGGAPSAGRGRDWSGSGAGRGGAGPGCALGRDGDGARSRARRGGVRGRGSGRGQDCARGGGGGGGGAPLADSPRPPREARQRADVCECVARGARTWRGRRTFFWRESASCPRSGRALAAVSVRARRGAGLGTLPRARVSAGSHFPRARGSSSASTRLGHRVSRPFAALSRCPPPWTRAALTPAADGKRAARGQRVGVAVTRPGPAGRRVPARPLPRVPSGKKVLIVYAHQEPRSFNGSLKDVAVAELSRQGCTVTVSDLYAMDFEPRATRKDITGALSSPEFFSYGVEAYEACKKRSLTSDIIAEQKKVQEADLVMFQSRRAMQPCDDGPAVRPLVRAEPHAALSPLRCGLLAEHTEPKAPSSPSSCPVTGSQGQAVRDRHGGRSASCDSDQHAVGPARPAGRHRHNARLREGGEASPPCCGHLPAWARGGGSPERQAEEHGSDPSAPCLPLPQFPLYWFSVPAVLKGWMDRVLCQGFAFDLPGFYDDGLLKGKLAILSLTTGGTADMYWKTGASGDFRYFLWPLQHGTLHFCGFKVLAPHISFAPEFASEEERRGMVASWAQRLKTIWKEEPIPCWPPWYFGQ